MNIFDDPPVDPAMDLRPLLFAGAEWYERAAEPGAHDEPIAAWRVAKSSENAWWVQMLNAAFAFARDHSLLEVYRTRFAGIRAADLTPARADAASRSVVGPIWQIANELVVARYLERVQGWTYATHEPAGRHRHRGDWQFTTPSGRVVFVEVKTLAERDWSGTNSGVYMKPDYRPRLREVMRGAYAQLPDDGRATLVVLVGREMLRIPYGIMHGDLFQALFGQMQISFPLGADFQTTKLRLAPSLRDMFVHRGKHRRLGCVAGLTVGGLEIPGLNFHLIHNPWAHAGVRLQGEECGDAARFVVDDAGVGHAHDGLHPRDVWGRMAFR